MNNTNINLRPITAENMDKCISLSVFDEQKGFVATNVYSLAQSKFFDTMNTAGIYNNDDMVGFCMYGKDIDDGCIWIPRLMIDKTYQNQGLGKKAMEMIINKIFNEYDTNNIFLSFEPENDVAKKLYSSFGFSDTGEIIDNEIVYKLEMTK